VKESGPSVIAYEAASLASLGNIEPERVLRFALLDVAHDNPGSDANTDILRAIVEKPTADHPLTTNQDRWVSMNLWRFNSAIFPACEVAMPSQRGELELADAVNITIARGVTFTVHKRKEGVLDLSHRSDVGALETRLAHLEPRP
jgi:dTDP-glucose pyrophosphorylase